MSDLEYDAGFKGLLGENAYYLLKVFVKEGKINGASIKTMADRMKVSGVYDDNKSLSREPLFDRMLEKWWLNEGRSRTGRLSSPTKAREILLDILEKSYVENIYQSEIRDAMEPIPESQSKSLAASSDGTEIHKNTAITKDDKMGESDWPEGPQDTVTIKDPIDSPGTPEIIDWTKNSFKLKWSPPLRENGAPVTHYTLEYREYEEDNWTTGPRVKAKKNPDGEVKDLTPGKKYEFRVRAENKAGLGNPSELTHPHLLSHDYCETGLSHLWGWDTLEQLRTFVRNGDISDTEISNMASRMNAVTTYKENGHKIGIEETFERMLKRWFDDKLFELSPSDAQDELVNVLGGARCARRLIVKIESLCKSI